PIGSNTTSIGSVRLVFRQFGGSMNKAFGGTPHSGPGNSANPAETGGVVKVAPPPLPMQEPYRPLGGYLSPTAEKEDVWQVVLDLCRILYKRKLLIASVALAFLGLGAVRTLMMTPLYSAVVRLQIDRTAPKIVEGGNVTPV